MDRETEALRVAGWSELLTEGEALALIRDASYFSKSPNSVIFTQGDSDDSLWIIARGRVVITKTLNSGEEKYIRELSEGAYFGELAVLDPAPRSTNIRTLEESAFLVIKRHALLSCLEQNGRLATLMLKTLGRQFRASDERLDTRRTVADRLMEVLTQMAREIPDGAPLSVSRVILAQRTGADVKTISRELTKLEQLGAITRKGKAIWLAQNGG